MSDAELFIRCDCHSPDHMLIFDAWHWDNANSPHSELCVSFSLDENASWWRRLGLAARYVFTGKTVEWWWADTVVRDADVWALRDYLCRYLERTINAQAIEAGTAETGTGSVHESAVTK